MQFSLRSLFVGTAICAVLCWFAFRLVLPLWAIATDAAGYALAFMIPCFAGVLLVRLKGSV